MSRQSLAVLPATGHDLEPALHAIRRGRPVLLVDDRDPRRECVLVMAAETVTPALVAWTVRRSSGCLSVALTASTCERLRLPRMQPDAAGDRPAFTVTVDASEGVGTGISAADRCRTIRLLAEPHTVASDFTRPGHVMPVATADGGLLGRRCRPEAALDLVRLAGRAPAAVLADLVDAADGACVGGAAGTAFAAAERLPMVTIGTLVSHRRGRAPGLRRLADVACPVVGAPFRAHGYATAPGGRAHVALVLGETRGAEALPVHVHRECPTADLFGSSACGCREHLDAAVRAVTAAGRGVVVYLRAAPGTGPTLRCPAASPASSTDDVDVAAILRDLAPASTRTVDPTRPAFEEMTCPSVAR
ncbi:hypothetical protein PSU4_21130 [Pseudonocardia sulfidoxydans NBRC 16205]|uniref:3,4-dihydroxy-2-butanone-4-phosphate synthase n=1 Tax=Pseudonocardia sulfidoxydans NBRC 16205 TaxID=1223511 RepID=A0A511DED0_9PSEU|nr:3,4-dihydroxy-2-butanone-4-phosphate synthase [Pseudonocardia sulfidoxydans]GEL23159.1 hypothetical protein PSU4_21130 [Pseudonocardia sulfidoxydans NBRC 16205]